MLKNAFQNIDLQKRALDASWLKQSIIANNIANIETPGYKRQELVFENVLQEAISPGANSLKTSHPKHFDVGLSSGPVVTGGMGFSHRIDENNVNIDVESAEQAKNTIKYNAMVNQVSAQIRRIKLAIKGG